MTCDECQYFKVLYEPLRDTSALWDMGRAVCKKHDLVCDFANHGKFKRLDICGDFMLKGGQK